MNPAQPRLFDSPDDDVVRYRAVCLTAVLGLLVGLVSVGAIISPLLWIVPVAGILLSGLALRQIARRAPALIGRPVALLGLTLSIATAVGGPTQWLAYRWMVRREARQFAAIWFDAVRNGEPHKAHQLSLDPRSRQPLDDRLWTFYRRGPRWRKQLETMVEQPAVRTLLTLGPAAEVRFYETVDQGADEDRDWVQSSYAVTYDDRGRRTTFFVVIMLERSPMSDGRAGWRIVNVDGGGRPPGW